MQSEIKFPANGKNAKKILENLREARIKDADWKNGKTWSLVYYGGKEIDELLKEAYMMFFSENGLSQRAFPSLKKFETEVVAMVADLLGGGDETTGTMTSGGTESIMMAVKTYRDKYWQEHPRISNPEMILPESAHPAFLKAGHYLGVKPVIIPLKDDYRVDIEAVHASINKNTILIVGSAPGYPHGVIDPIRDLAKLALENNIGCHVDACLGGFFLPFAQKLGYNIPNFDFRVPGVTSISVDLHKYGFAAKGASTILYRDRKLRKYQFYVFTEWPGGVYASPALAGTRPGGSLAAAWAIMNFLGEEGYLKVVGNIMKTTGKLIEGIKSIPDLYVIGEPEMSVFAFSSDSLNIHQLGNAMATRGWYISRQHKPDALHLMVTLAHENIVDQFISDLRECVKFVNENKQDAPLGGISMYGGADLLPCDGGLHEHVLNQLDELLTVGD